MAAAPTAPTDNDPRHCTACGTGFEAHRIGDALDVHRCPGCAGCVTTFEALRAACPSIVRADLVEGDPLGPCRACGNDTRRLAYRGYPAMTLGECAGCHRLVADRSEPFERYLALQAQASDPAATQALGRELGSRFRRQQVYGDLSGLGATASRRPVPFVGTRLAAMAIPIGAERHGAGAPWGTVGLMLVTFAVSIAMAGASAEALAAWAVWPRGSAEGSAAGLLGHAFVHADLLHLLGNLYFLWLFGPGIEDQVGRLRLVGLYLVLAIVAALAWRLTTPVEGIPAVGGSGAIAGLMGLYTRWCWERRMKVVMQGGVVTVPAFLFLIVWLVFQLIHWVVSESLVAWEAHIGGFVAGLLVALVWTPRSASDTTDPRPA